MAEQREFASEWTRETTQARREAWNAWVRAEAARSGGKVHGAAVSRREAEQGWTAADLKRAVAAHKL